MKIKMKTSIAGGYNAKAGETIDVDDTTAQRLIFKNLAADAASESEEEVRDFTASADFGASETKAKKPSRKKGK